MHPHRLGRKLAVAALGTAALGGCDLGAEEEKATATKPAGDSWIVVAQGDRPAEDQPFPARPATEDDDENEVLHLPEADEVIVEQHDPRCTGATAAGEIAPLAVQADATSATVSWHHPGDPAVTTYRVTSMAQDLAPGDRPELVWQETEPGEGCHDLRTTVTGLQTGTAYVFSVDAVRKPTWTNTTRTATVARSEAIRMR